MERFAGIILPHFPDFELIEVRANTMSDPEKTLAAKLQVFEEKIGRHSFLNLMQLNAVDMELYHFVKQNFWSEEG